MLTVAAAVIFGLAAWIALAALWGLRREPPPGLLGAMLSRHGVDWGTLAASGALNDLALGLRRCNACGENARCRQWLDSGAREGYQSFCPNAAFVERMKVVRER